ncbi:DUF192 domain-containing protein [Mesorhizobium sp. YIM 152430]|uniref:DUF192 domain-containing protein n=1 Tax=Mesorhizobium sp. YIM 152430 TaxID=3031761 RepID=UPI0023DBE0CF|nr:DUF192 domain-containing protein [Mesorhizobium sp. YIM 152430]MDF1599832.1 DUF192 domain-containing protein [Mesorhizobium sp. YIM 152430]
MNARIAAIALSLFLAGAPLALTPPVAVAQEAVQGAPMELPVDAAPLTFEADGETVSFEIEIADTAERRARGLMFRTDLPEDRGMLFVFEETRPVGFWMKNTPSPLDLVFIGEDGRVIDILPGEPFSTASIAPDGPSRFVLELNQGTSQRVGLAPGTRLNHPAIDEVAGN